MKKEKNQEIKAKSVKNTRLSIFMSLVFIGWLVCNFAEAGAALGNKGFVKPFNSY